MSVNLSGLIDFFLALLRPEPVRAPIPIRVDRSDRRR